MPLTPLSTDALWAIEPRTLARIQTALNTSPQEFFASALASTTSDIFPKSEDPGYTNENGVAIIPLSGVMMKGGGWLLSLLGGTDTATFTQAVTQAATDPSVKAILLDIDSPGGMIAGCVEAADAVMTARSLKPTHAYVADCCASAAYWIGSQAHAIHGSAGAMIGAIGVYQTLYDSSKAAERAGVKVHVVGSGPLKGAGEDGTEITPEMLADRQRMVDTIAKVFTGYVCKGRKMKAEDVSKLADGRSWFGKDAVSRGLIDGIAPRATVMTALQAYKPGRGPARAINIAAYNPPSIGENTMPSLWDQLKAHLDRGDGNADPVPETAEQAFNRGLAAARATVQASASLLAAPVQFEGVSPLKAEIDAQKAQIDALKSAQAETVKAANRAAVEGFMRAGAFPAAELEQMVTRRASAPDVFDDLMKTRPINPLSASAISGDDAMARLDPTASQGFLAECKAYLREQGVHRVNNRGGQITQNGGAR